MNTVGHKNLCLDCRKTFNQGTDFHDIRKSTCPDCSKPMIQMSNRFRPPKKSDDLKWKVVNYLFDNGFYYQHIKNPNDNKYVVYPENLRDA